ncbi:diaminopimelate epimerase [Wukongibacter baidiensis]|uniref:diaminopimelate epimerase n=1 Tax=Wukongibacter baidiensis TaxID=1723361 RepID=UPI003D7F9D68
MINFSKMHGAGNDFVIVTAGEVDGIDYSALAKEVCDRHFGIGADGLMIVDESKTSDVRMHYYNSDGSLGEMCGNGIRCFSRFTYEKGIVNKEVFTVETLAGEKIINLTVAEDGKAEKILVDMGIPSIEATDVPVNTEKQSFINEEITVDETSLKVSSILMGVPHTIIFTEDLTEDIVYKYGPVIEKKNIYPRKTNVNFVQIIDSEFMKVDTWERGAGKTLACGTGVCASVFVANLLNYVGKKVLVNVPGGKLNITIDNNNRVFMEGTAKLICDGKYYFNKK